MLNMEYYAADELCAYSYDGEIIVMDGFDNIPFSHRVDDSLPIYRVEVVVEILNQFIDWLYRDFPVKITDEERTLLHLLHSQGYGWISRDRNGNLLISTEHSDVDQYNFNVFGNLFESIAADRAYFIPDLLNS